MELIKKKSNLTRMLILRELVIEEPKDQRSIADNIDITPQAVSEYLKLMKEAGLVDLGTRPPKATVRGVDLLQRDLLQLKDFIDRSIDGLEIVRSTDAIAASNIKKGDRLRTFLDNGLLYCKAGEGGPSTGIADNDGNRGDIVMISGLSGVITMPEVKMAAIEIIPARQGGGSLRISKKTIEKAVLECSMGDQFRIAVLDQEAASLMKRSMLAYDLEIPRAPTLKETLQRGLSLLCIGTPHTVSKILTSQEISSLDVETCRLDLSKLV